MAGSRPGKRAQARAAGLIKYSSGKKCKWNHLAERFVSTGQCCACQKAKDARRRKDRRAEVNAYNRGWRARRKAALNGSKIPNDVGSGRA